MGALLAELSTEGICSDAPLWQIEVLEEQREEAKAAAAELARQLNRTSLAMIHLNETLIAEIGNLHVKNEQREHQMSGLIEERTELEAKVSRHGVCGWKEGG